MALSSTVLATGDDLQSDITIINKCNWSIKLIVCSISAPTEKSPVNWETIKGGME